MRDDANGFTSDDATPDGGPTDDGATDDAATDDGMASTDEGGVTSADGAGPEGGYPADSGADGAKPDAASDTCDFSGTWGFVTTIDVSWTGGGFANLVISPGSGTIRHWIRSARTVAGTAVAETATICGLELPPFHSNVNETYGISFPDSLFDHGGLANFAIAGTVSSTSRTATYTTSPMAELLGLTLPNATTAGWPLTITTETDDDNDSHPGVTANVQSSTGLSLVPLDFGVIVSPQTVARADQLYLSIRQVTAVTAQFSDCDHASGTVTVPQMVQPGTATSRYALDTHAVGCRVQSTGLDCSASQVTFVDQNQPVFVPTRTKYLATRMAPGADCAAVRAALP
jgi:hypothetical protein